uniref:family 78 glycoside hydrolase catalytic domain n=2 Tax=Bacteroides salyersiae TaxID=291644 RepID=UPI001C8C4CCA|nr:family 78 glycoside hydrolase catalytic domain [Bacteroides salyersiae]
MISRCKTILLTMFLLTSPYFLAAYGVKEGEKNIEPVGLQCEYLHNPLGLDISHPRLSWKMGTTFAVRGQRQTAYQVLVASSRESLDKEQGDLWDSGQVRSDESVNIVYDGKTLVTGQKCFWKVRLADEQGSWTAWSEPAYWQMGLFAGDWSAHWIGSAEMESQSMGGQPVDNKMFDPWFRKTFTLTESLKEALVYVASIGYHELYVNGCKIGNTVLAPSVTDHKSRARYVTYDISHYLKKGENVIALWLGTSWAVFPAYQRNDKPAIPMALVQAEITLTSGSKVRVITDGSWKTHASPNMLMGYWDAHHFAGEFYDASLEINGWNEVGFDDSDWEEAKVYRPQVMVSADKTEPNLLMNEIKPVAVEEVSPGVYRVDMGINYAGWFEMPLVGQPGDSVVFRFSEREKDTCSYGIHSIYKIGPGGKGTFRNRFNYMTGRWVQITGLRSVPDLKQIRGWMIRPDFRRSSGFECDIPLLNDLYHTTLWTFENLSLGNYIVDCPHRERRGYGGDALATTRTGLDNYQLGAFYTKWMEDWRDVQGEDGNVPYTAPTYIGGGGPSWSGFCITLPWEVYRQYGDVCILEESFSTIRGWLDFVETKSKDDMLVRWGGKWSFLGDWLWPNAWPERSAMEKEGKALGDTRETLFFNNCHWIYSLETAACIADVLGNETMAVAWRKRAEEVRRAVHKTFFNPDDNSYVNGYPAYLAIALMVDLPPEKLKAKVWKRLEYEILVNRKGHFWGGITAGSFLFHTLLDNQRNDLICEMATKEDFPSWGNMIKNGNGTFFEDWECRGSALHSSYLYIGSWFVESLGGIQRPKSGFKEFVIAPWVDEKGPRQVRSHYNSMYGTIVSNWKVTDDKLDIEVVVPANTTALLKLPGVRLDSIEEEGSEWKKAKGVRLDSQRDNTVVFSLQSGTYRFSARMN